MDTARIQELVDIFRDNVIAQNIATAQNDTQRGNRCALAYDNAWEHLRCMGNIGREALSVLLTHARSDVRGMAAAYLLRYKTAESIAVLEEIVRSSDGVVAFGAVQTLNRWMEGDWHLDD